MTTCWLSKGGDRFCIWYLNLSRNSTYCMKVSMSVTIEASDEGKCFSSKMRYMEKAEITHGKMMSCPDIEDYLAPYKQPQMNWYKECEQIEWRKSIVANSTHVWIPEVEEGDGGNYTCELQYGSRLVRRTLLLKVTGKKPTHPPRVLFPPEKQTHLDCKAFFGYSGENKQPIVYLMKGEKFVEELAGHIKKVEVRRREVQLSLIFDAVEEADLDNYTCYVENHIGRAQRKYMYRLELAGGLGIILLLLGVLTAFYKFQMSKMTFYFYIYDLIFIFLFSLPVRMNDDEETLALEILPDVLENQYGYKLFIPDRDLIPSSTYVEDLARSVDQSRRLILVLTPDFVAKRGWSVFLIETRLHSMLVTGEIKVIMIECVDLKNVINYQEVELLKQTIKALSVIKWKGPKSNKPTSKFWKQMLYEMPAKQKEILSKDQVVNRKGESTVPCGAPVLLIRGSDTQLRSLTNCGRPVR
uniref:Interleukin 1 receptor accessory protein-like 2 n=1 Tax=Takifugu rubripes TaxID=31033 RepID=A0A674PKY0_TAKRU